MEIGKVFAEAQSYEALCALAEKAEPKISFWGAQYLVVEGYESSLDIDSVVRRMSALVKKNHEFNQIERSYGKRIASRVSYIYEKSDEILKTCNLFTKILVFLRSLNCNLSHRDYWQLYQRKFIFEAYTESQFEKVFGYPMTEAKKRGIRLEYLEYDADRARIFPNS